MSSPPMPITPPLYATNSWIITRARAMIDYDSYGSIEDWLDNVEDDDAIKSLDTSHPAGEYEDYDPDHQVLNSMSVVERLEAAAAKLEAMHYDAKEEEQESDCEDALSMTSSSFRSRGYGYLPSDSLENEPLVCDRQHANMESAVGAETPPVPSSQPISDNNSPSQLLAVPPPAYTARAQQGKAKRQGRKKRFIMPRVHSYSDMDNLNEGLSIERGLSPIPRIHRWASSLASSAPSRGPDSGENASASDAPATLNMSAQSPAQSNQPRLRISNSRRTPSPEILSPIPQRAGQLLVPGPPRKHFIGSPFAGSKGTDGVQVPALVIKPSNDDEKTRDENCD